MIIERLTPISLVVTDAEIRSHLRIGEQEWLEEMAIVRLYAAAAQGEAERITRRSIGPATYRVTQVGPVTEVEIGNPPLVSVDTVTDDQDYEVVYRNGIPVVSLDGLSGASVVITYQSGYAVVPEEIKAWILLRIGSYYENREADSTKPAVPLDFAKELLTPYISRLVLG